MSSRFFVALRFVLIAFSIVSAAPAVKAGSWLYVSSQSSNQVLLYDPNTGDSKGTFASAPAKGNFNPSDLVFGPDGKLFVAWYNGSGIFRYDPDKGTVLGGGVFASIKNATSFAFGPNGDLYVGSIQIFSSSVQGAVAIFDGKTGASKGYLIAPGAYAGNFQPHALRFGQDGNLYITDSIANSVLRYDFHTGTKWSTLVSSMSGGLSGPSGLAFTSDGDLLVSSYLNDKILRYDGTTGAFLSTFTSGGSLDGPVSMAAAGGKLYVSSANNDSILQYDLETGAFLDVFVTPNSGGLDGPWGLAIVPEPSTGVLAVIFAGTGVCWIRRRWRNAETSSNSRSISG